MIIIENDKAHSTMNVTKEGVTVVTFLTHGFLMEAIKKYSEESRTNTDDDYDNLMKKKATKEKRKPVKKVAVKKVAPKKKSKPK